MKTSKEELGEIETQEALEEVFWEYSTEDMIGKLLEMGFTETEIKAGISTELARIIKEWYEK